MNAQELRELDAWIAVNLFGWIKTDVKLDPTDNRAIGGALFSPQGCPFDCGEGSVVLRYTANPADAMDVLKKCAETTALDPIKINCQSAMWYVAEWRHRSIEVEALTIELAICLFAKKLFS